MRDGLQVLPELNIADLRFRRQAYDRQLMYHNNIMLKTLLQHFQLAPPYSQAVPQFKPQEGGGQIFKNVSSSTEDAIVETMRSRHS